MKLGRNDRQHKTAGVVSEDYWIFKPGQRVMTVDRIAGVVTRVEDGPHPTTELYIVALDNGLGGGSYSASELTSMSGNAREGSAGGSGGDLGTGVPHQSLAAESDTPFIHGEGAEDISRTGGLGSGEWPDSTGASDSPRVPQGEVHLAGAFELDDARSPHRASSAEGLTGENALPEWTPLYPGDRGDAFQRGQSIPPMQSLRQRAGGKEAASSGDTSADQGERADSLSAWASEDAGEHLRSSENGSGGLPGVQAGVDEEFLFEADVVESDLHTADADYPELANILVERPPLAHSVTAAKKTAAVTVMLCRALRPTGPQYHVHAVGCPDLMGRKYDAVECEPLTVSSLSEIVSNIYPPKSFLYDPNDPVDAQPYLEDVRVFPCVSGLTAAKEAVQLPLDKGGGNPKDSAYCARCGRPAQELKTSANGSQYCPDCFAENLSGQDVERLNNVSTRKLLPLVAVNDEFVFEASDLGTVYCKRCGHRIFNTKGKGLCDRCLSKTSKEAKPLDRIVAPFVNKIMEKLPPEFQSKPGDWYSYDWCRFRKRRQCYYSTTLDVEATKQAGYSVWVPTHRGECPRDAWDDPKGGTGQKQCPVAEPGPNSRDRNALVDATVPWSEGGQRGDPVTVRRAQLEKDAARKGEDTDHCKACGSDDLHGGFYDEEGLYSPEATYWTVMCNRCGQDQNKKAPSKTKNAAWTDVERKGAEIRRNGGVTILSVLEDKGTPGQLRPTLTVTAQVEGDTGTYETQIIRGPNDKSLAIWSCSCAWSSYSWGRTRQWTKYEGRPCSHAMALWYEVQAEEMQGYLEEFNPPKEAPKVKYYEKPASLQKSAGFMGKVRGEIHEIVELLPGGLARIDTGEVVAETEIVYPSYHPTLGLDFADSTLTVTGATAWQQDYSEAASDYDFGPNDITRIVRDVEIPVSVLRDPANVDIVRGLGGWSTSDTHPHPNFTDERWASFLEDISRNGIKDPITVAVEKDGKITVIDGTHRIAAAAELGLFTVPVAELRYFGGSDRLVRYDKEAKTVATKTAMPAGYWQYQMKRAFDGETVTVTVAKQVAPGNMWYFTVTDSDGETDAQDTYFTKWEALQAAENFVANARYDDAWGWVGSKKAVNWRPGDQPCKNCGKHAVYEGVNAEGEAVGVFCNSCTDKGKRMPRGEVVKLRKMQDTYRKQGQTDPDGGPIIEAAGIAVKAEDTGRVLLHQRNLEDDSAPGEWEFIGGHVDPGEEPFAAAEREFKEETGMQLPPGKLVGSEVAESGTYIQFIYTVPEEFECTGGEDESGPNVCAWFDPEDVEGNPILRDEAKENDWESIKAAVKVKMAGLHGEHSNPEYYLVFRGIGVTLAPGEARTFWAAVRKAHSKRGPEGRAIMHQFAERWIQANLGGSWSESARVAERFATNNARGPHDVALVFKGWVKRSEVNNEFDPGPFWDEGEVRIPPGTPVELEWIRFFDKTNKDTYGGLPWGFLWSAGGSPKVVRALKNDEDEIEILMPGTDDPYPYDKPWYDKSKWSRDRFASLTAEQRKAIEQIRNACVAAGEVNAAGGPSCGVTAEEVAAAIGGREMYGAYATGSGTPSHAWVELADGTIVDPTADQFGGEPIAVIPPGDPRHARYLDQSGDDYVTAELKDEPEPALPETTGEDQDEEKLPEKSAAALKEDVASRSWLMEGGGAKTSKQDNAEIAAAAANFLKTGMKSFSPAEQKALIDEGEGVTASNLDRLNIAGTHYELLESSMAQEDELSDSWLL